MANQKKSCEEKIRDFKKQNLFLEQEIIRLSSLVIQKVKEGKEIRRRLEKALLENERRRAELEGQIQKRTKELQEKVRELEKFQKMAVGRELKMVELKEEIENFKKSL
ncbi:hypothetical protein KKB68_00945 [Patescibacteria group bacterium]|nr:hypothetical protein [Patescibacteria group bacterium]